jgi:rhodanese-related sulfurtransferase
MEKLLFVLLSLLLSASVVLAAAEPFTAIGSEELHRMLKENPATVVVMDTRSANEHAEAHIEGALSMPLATMEANPALPALPKDTLIVFYCTGYS